MDDSIMKKIKYIVLFTLFACCIWVTGCEKRGPVATPIIQEDINKVVQWRTSHIPLSDLYEEAIIDGGKIYAYRYGQDNVSVEVFYTDTMELLQSYVIPGLT